MYVHDTPEVKLSKSLPHLPVLSHEDNTRNWEVLGGVLPDSATPLDERYLQLLKAANHKLAFGESELEWTAKAFESAALEVTTGLTTAHFNYGQIAGTFGYLTTLGVVGGVVTWKARANEELPLGTKRILWWLAIE